VTVEGRSRSWCPLPDEHPDADLARRYPGTILATRDLLEVIAELPPREPSPPGTTDRLLEEMRREKL